MLSWVSVSSHLMGKHQTFTCVKSCKYIGLSGHSSPLYQANIFPIVCAVLALDSWNCCSEEEGSKAQHPLLNVCPYGLFS